MPDVLNVLIKAKNLIAKPENWCVSVFNMAGPDGISYCSRGAIFDALGFGLYDYDCWDLDDEPYCSELVKGLPKPLPQTKLANEAVAQYNNTHSHKEIIAMFDTAIERLSAENTTERYLKAA